MKDGRRAEEHGTGALCVVEDGVDEEGVMMRACCGSWEGKQTVKTHAQDGVEYLLFYTAVVCVRKV